MKLNELLGIAPDKILNTNTLMDEDQKQSSTRFQLKSGLSSLDTILKGGFLAGKKYLIFGGYSAGKTQLCHQLCFQAYLKDSELKSQKSRILTYYIDTENTFRPERIEEFSKLRGLNTKSVLDSIYYSHISSNSTLLLKLKEIQKNEKENALMLLIIDSINNLYRSEYSRSNISHRAHKIEFLSILSVLHNITMKFNIITIATAQVTPNFLENAIIPEIPAGNSILNHYFSEYLYLKVQANGKRRVHVVNSQYLPENESNFYEITSQGIIDEG